MNPWKHIDEMKREAEQLKTTLASIGWAQCASEDVFYVARRKTKPPQWGNRPTKIRALKPALLLEEINKVEAEFTAATKSQMATT